MISEISRAMAAPVEMAIPASASDRAGESLTPSPIMMTVCPAARLPADEVCLILRQDLGVELRPPLPPSATQAAVRRLSPVIMTTLRMPQSWRARMASWPRPAGDRGYRSRRQLPGQTQIEVGVLGGQGVELLLLPGGDGAALVLENEVGAADEGLSPFTMLEMPWATMYCT